MPQAELHRFAPWCTFHTADQPPILETNILWYDEAGLGLFVVGDTRPFYVDEGALKKRSQYASLKASPSSGLAKACGVANSPSVLDAFGGFGFDGLALSLLGCHVTILEHERIVWLLLTEFVHRCGLSVPTQCCEALSFLVETKQRWDVIYLDPMFPPRSKKSLPNRGMQMLQMLASPTNLDLEYCLEVSQNCARQRVVLKRRAKDRVLGHPSHQIKGKSIRFDVYL